MRTRIKICGITRPEDARVAARLGADAIGLVFYPGSPRAVTIEQAQAITEALTPFVTVVGLFVDAEHFAIQDILDDVVIDVLQFHGSESHGMCSDFGLPYIKAIRMHEDVDVEETAAQYHDALGLLLDTWSGDSAGGTGQIFDWARVPVTIDKPIILAGGLTADNVDLAIKAVRPYAVDVSSGVEMDKGSKDPDKIADFIDAVNRADEF